MAKLVTIGNFGGGHYGNQPSAPVIDADGNLIGTTAYAGYDGDGTVYEIARTQTGYASPPTLLVSFQYDGIDGDSPGGPLIQDAAGNLYGTTRSGGTQDDGTIFELGKTATGYASTPTVLANFGLLDGRLPLSGVIMDAAGNLFGTTEHGGAGGFGTVFELVKTGAGYASTITTLVSFNGTNGQYLSSAPVLDAGGNLLGTTGDGHVYEVAKTASGYDDTPTIIASLTGLGADPSGLSIGRDGNLFGTFLFGGTDNVGGVFEIQKTVSGYAGTPTILADFDGTDGARPAGGVTIDADGNLWGTSEGGGENDTGTIWEIAKIAGGYDSTPRVVVSFGTSGASTPYTGLVADAKGDLFGGTVNVDTDGQGGAVFEVTDSGFVACYARGTLIRTHLGDVAVEALAIGDIVVTQSGAHRPIKWIGHRAYDGRFIAGNRDVLPIRIRAGALDTDVPARDLLVSPHHALYLDGVLVPAEHLINGVSIVQEMHVEHVEYFHIELDSHDILLAENTPAESFIDCDSRAMFHNAAAFAARYPHDTADATFCAERIEGGPALARIWSRIARRAGITEPGGVLRGAIDRVDRVAITGWAAGADDTPVALDVEIDGVAVGRVLANRKRADLADAGFGAGRHGFALALAPLLDPTRAHRVTIRRASDGALLAGAPVLLPALPRAVAAPALAPLLAAIETLRMARADARVTA